MSIKLILVLATFGLLSVNTCHASGGPWEFAALYHLTGPKIGTGNTVGDYTLLFYKQKGEYADATFNVSYSINSVEGIEGIETAEDDAKALWKDTVATDVAANQYSTHLNKDTNYRLVFDDEHAVSAFTFKFNSTESNGADCGSDCHFIFFFQPS